MIEPVTEVSWRPASSALAPYVDRYMGYRFAGHAPGIHQGLPSRHLTIVIALGAPVRVASMPDPRQAPGSFVALAGGLHAAPVTIAHDGSQHGISVDLGPLGARRLLGLPASALASTVLDLDAVLGPRVAQLPDRLASAPTWAARFRILDEAFGRMLVDAPSSPPEVGRAWQRLVATGGAVPVADLAEEVGWTRRYLSQRFRSELGLSPKTAARVLRFERAVRQLRLPHRPPLAEVAAACGYFDQAHLNRDWRALAGCTPTQWLAEEFPILQDPPGAPASS